jgi:hypothetical protein
MMSDERAFWKWSPSAPTTQPRAAFLVSVDETLEIEKGVCFPGYFLLLVETVTTLF